MRVLVDRLRSLLESRIRLQHDPAQRCVDLGDRLDRFDRAQNFAASHRAPLIGKFDEDDVAQLRLSELGDADGPSTLLDPQPLVLFRVMPVLWIHLSPDQ